jgi:uncharacterized membrane protein
VPAPRDDDRSRARRSGNPAVRAGAVPPSSPARQELERRSRPWLVRLVALPRWLVLLVVLALAVTGLLLPGWVGAAILVVVGLLAGWLTALAWPALGPGARAARVLILLLLAVDVGIKIATS